ncbi:hypothetical protein ACFPYJ_14305 [Paenibacillus solisilvae]|uniref:Holin-like toxin n=1 Tax=Paenibacillus solisilvae TaxID=2486751 RepID=A0ABW0VWN2_9BACL
MHDHEYLYSGRRYLVTKEEKPEAKEHYEYHGGNEMSAELLIQLLMLIVMVITLAKKSD